MYGFYEEKLHVNQFWESKGYLKGWSGCEKNAD